MFDIYNISVKNTKKTMLSKSALHIAYDVMRQTGPARATKKEYHLKKQALHHTV